MQPRSTTSQFTRFRRALVGLLGAGSFGTGVCAVFMTQNGTGTGVLLALGGVLLVLALLGDRLESFELGGAKLRMRAAAADRYALAEESERHGDLDTARRLRAEAQTLLEAAGPVAAAYRSVRGSMHHSAERTQAMDAIVSRARRLAEEQQFDPAVVLRWLQEGTDEERITALSMMQAIPELRNFEATLAAIEHSHSAFEQYHAMLLAAKMMDDLDTHQLGQLSATLVSQRGDTFHRSSDRWLLSESILQRMTARSGAASLDHEV